MASAGPSVGGVRIHLERWVGSGQVTNCCDLLDVGAGLDLELDADVAVVDVSLDGGQQLLDTVVDTDAHTARNAGPLRTEERRERLPGRSELGVEDRLKLFIGRVALQVLIADEERRRGVNSVSAHRTLALVHDAADEFLLVEALVDLFLRDAVALRQGPQRLERVLPAPGGGRAADEGFGSARTS